MASVVSAVMHPAHPWGFAWRGPAPAPTQDSQAVAALQQCHRKGGDTSQLLALHQLRYLSEAGWRTSSSCFLVPDRSLKFKSGLVWAR